MQSISKQIKRTTQTQSGKSSRLCQIFERPCKTYGIHHQRQSGKSSRPPNPTNPRSYHMEGGLGTRMPIQTIPYGRGEEEEDGRLGTCAPHIYPTSPLGDRWFRSIFNQITPLPTLSPGLRSGLFVSVTGLYHFLQTLENAGRELQKVQC